MLLDNRQNTDTLLTEISHHLRWGVAFHSLRGTERRQYGMFARRSGRARPTGETIATFETRGDGLAFWCARDLKPGGQTIDAIAVKSPLWLGGAAAVAALAAAGYVLGWFSIVVTGFVVVGAGLFIAGSLFGKGGTTKGGDIAHQVGFIAAGLGALALGSDYLIASSTSIARTFGVSDVIIGLTIVAAGTSLPEVAASIIATIRKERDIAIGNVVGSNIFNILGIIGLSAMVTPGGLSVHPLIIRFDMPVMIAVAVACLPIFFSGFAIARWEGVLFLGSYIAYTLFLILVATRNPALETFTSAMLLALPLIAVTLIWTSVQFFRAWRNTRSPKSESEVTVHD